MNQQLKSIFLLALTSICLTAGSANAVKIATPAPVFTLKDINGTTVTLESLKGKVVVLNFWSTDCAPCVAEIPSLNALYQELKDSGLVVIGISLDGSVAPVKEMKEEMHIAYPLLMDSDRDVYFDTYSLYGQPVSILIDRSGIVQDKVVGQVDWQSPQKMSRIKSLLKGR